MLVFLLAHSCESISDFISHHSPIPRRCTPTHTSSLQTRALHEQQQALAAKLRAYKLSAALPDLPSPAASCIPLLVSEVLPKPMETHSGVVLARNHLLIFLDNRGDPWLVKMAEKMGESEQTSPDPGNRRRRRSDSISVRWKRPGIHSGRRTTKYGTKTWLLN